VRRDGRWTLPHRLALHTRWCNVMLDLTSAVRSGPELVIEMRVQGGNVELVLAPGMVVDANELSVRHSCLAISRDAERPSGRPYAARPDQRPMAGAGPLTCRPRSGRAAVQDR
jgi:hypothetical protein